MGADFTDLINQVIDILAHTIDRKITIQTSVSPGLCTAGDPSQLQAALLNLADKGVAVIGVLPQVLPVIYGTTIYRWDINIRESTVLGFVGAGGIGIVLYSSINLFAWHEVSVILVSIFGVVILSEYLSIKARARIT